MYSMMVRSVGDPSTLERVDGDDPTPAPGQVLISVRAAACNFFDMLLCQGRYQVRPEPPFAPGAEVCGVVAALGEGVREFKEGDPVLALLPWGGYASAVCADVNRVFRIPETMPFEHGAAFGIVYQTAWFALKHRARMRAGETLLVHAAAGGVGLAAVQLGKAMRAHVIGTAGAERKVKLAMEQGARHAFSYETDAWVDQVKEVTGGRGADVILDPVGGDIFNLSTKVIAWEGRLVVIGFAGGTIPTVQANRVLLKNCTVQGLHWGPYLELQPGLVRTAMHELFTMYLRGEVRPLISARRPLDEAGAALTELASRRTTGKVVLLPE